MAAVSTKVIALLAAVIVALFAAAAAVRVLEKENVLLGSLAPALTPAPGPAMVSTASAVTQGSLAVAAVVSVLAFLGH